MSFKQIWQKNNYLMVPDSGKSLWVRCPVCRRKTRTKVYSDTTLIRFPLYCPKCREEYRIDVIKLRMTLSDWARRNLAQSLLSMEGGSRLFFAFCEVSITMSRASALPEFQKFRRNWQKTWMWRTSISAIWNRAGMGFPLNFWLRCRSFSAYHWIIWFWGGSSLGIGSGASFILSCYFWLI